MSAALIWVFIPGLLGLLALLARRLGPYLNLALAVASLVLAWIAWQFPIDQALEAGASAFKINASFSVLGRSLTITDAQRPLIVFVFLANTLWLLGAFLALPGRMFPGVSQISIAFFVAAISVEPFLYAAIFIAFIVLASVTMLVEPGQSVPRGLLRYLVFQLLGIPFILFVGWMLAGVEASPGNSLLVLRAGILLVLGFAFLLAVFPFHSWLPMLARASHPYPFAFLAFLLPFASSLLGLAFFERFAWIRDSANLDQSLMLIGAAIAAIGAAWALIQTDMRRQMGYLIVFQTGLWLAAIGLYAQVGLTAFLGLALAHLIAMLLWSIAISGLRLANHGDLNLSALSRISQRHPILLLSYLLSIAAFAALPLSLSFFPRLELIAAIAQHSSAALLPLILAHFLVLLLFLRSLYLLANPLLDKSRGQGEESLLGRAPDPLIPDRENGLAMIYLVLLLLLSLLFALFPAAVFERISQLAAIFPQIVQ